VLLKVPRHPTPDLRPFQGFVADVAEDIAYAIPTPDHVFIGIKTLAIEDDEGNFDLVPYQHIRRIRQKQAA
jgi:hypothetical protein